MPQEHYVLRCFSCETFQAHIVKKTNKWECKICGLKQSVKRNYGKGSGKDCRNQVMKLNELRLKDDYNLNEPEDGIFDEDFTAPEVQQPDPNKPLTSKWIKYLEPLNDSESELGDSVTDICRNLKEKKKKRVKEVSEDFTNKNKKICSKSDCTVYYKSAPFKRQSSPQTDNKNCDSYRTKEEIVENLESCKVNEKSVENSETGVNNTLKSSKYAKFLDGDDEDVCGKENQNEKGSFGKLTVFSSDTNDLDDILRLE